MPSPVLAPTPLEAVGYARLSRAAEIHAWLEAFAAAVPGAERWSLGMSAGGRPLSALRLRPLDASGPALRVLLVGGQHGASEAAGGEALLLLARELACGALRPLRAHFDLLLLPDANPDGRDLDTPRNADEVNINRDFVLLTQPESRALARLLAEFAPQAVLDAHESAVLKRKTLGREGWMTDFDTQFDSGNHPAIPRALRDYGEHRLLPALLADLAAAGARAQRYIREIQSTSQAVTHGGLTARNFRNRAALGGALAVLLETRMDPRDGIYPSFRNIAARCARQLLAQRAFLGRVVQAREAIAALVAAHAASAEDLALEARYVPHEPPRTVAIALRALADGVLREFAMPDHRRVVHGPALPLPRSYQVVAHTASVARLLDAHGIPWRRRVASERRRVVSSRLVGTAGWHEDAPAERDLPADSLEVPVGGRLVRLLPTLLEPRSSCGLFGHAAFARLVAPGDACFVLREPA